MILCVRYYVHRKQTNKQKVIKMISMESTGEMIELALKEGPSEMELYMTALRAAVGEDIIRNEQFLDAHLDV